MEKQREERAKAHDTAIQQVEDMNKQVADQITSLQPSQTTSSHQPPPGPASSPSPLVTTSQMQTMGQEVFSSLYSGNPDPSIISSFASMMNLAAAKAGIHGFAFSPVVSKGPENHPGEASNGDTGGGGTKRDSSPTPVAQAPRPKEPKTDTQA
eukprot:7248359-Karenia_brevis.AAC.1